MISLRRPSDPAVEACRSARTGLPAQVPPIPRPPPGFRNDRFRRVVGSGPNAFARAREGLERWVAHRGSGVDVYPAGVALSEGDTVAIVTRQLGLWVLAACRVESVIDEPGRFGFVYATLPDHPECGYESFVVTDDDGEITFEIEAVSRPGIALVKLGAPVTKVLQRRATDAYLDALATWIEGSSPPG